jgi:hypothetical protein
MCTQQPLPAEGIIMEQVERRNLEFFLGVGWGKGLGSE